jgi:hypothetical protein
MISPVFKPGEAGTACAGSGGAPALAAAVAGRTVSISSAAPWIEVTGSLAEDGTIAATGRGTMAGVPNVLVQFDGTFDMEAGTLVGTYTMDPEKLIDPGHPLVYGLDLSGG